MIQQPQDYLIWSNEHEAWWGPGERGYVQTIAEAGRYTRQRAQEICARALLGRTKTLRYPELPINAADLREMFSTGLSLGQP